jgi:hypothetical protein
MFFWLRTCSEKLEKAPDKTIIDGYVELFYLNYDLFSKHGLNLHQKL